MQNIGHYTHECCEPFSCRIFFEIIHITANSVICLNNTNFCCTYMYIMVVNICEALPKSIVNVSTLLIHFRPCKLQGFECIHVCKCDKSVKRKTVKQFYLFLSNEMIKIDFITQHWQHTIVSQMNLYDNTSIILIA